jgi:hypothetical protein
MKRAAFILATAATLAVTAVVSPAPAEARGGFGPGLAGGLIAGALIGGIASNAYGYGPGYGYYGGYGPGYDGGYAPAYYGGSGCRSSLHPHPTRPPSRECAPSSAELTPVAECVTRTST